jgi:SNF2 family DNA or RNA helicase
MLAGLYRNNGPRAQLVGSMGLGKSGAILLQAAAIEFMTGRWPGLVILAPLQVAFNWRKEIEAWLPGKRWVLAAGSEADRKAALYQSADIYLLTYDNLPWLDDLQPGSWGCLGSMMVCDESQRVKHLRASIQTSSTGKRWLRTDGGAQTNALARHAGDFSYWLNATGSLRPNGAMDLWGQYWFLDGGRRLGNSFTDFSMRWFMLPTRRTEFDKPIPKPGAEAEIAALTADITTVVRTEDYYDVAAPVITDRYVELPARARVVYAEMKKRARAEIEAQKEVTAKSAAAKVGKLLQIASGFVYWADDLDDPDLKLCETLHSVKMDAVDSILQETGEPLVVVYYYKATLEMLRAKFKKRLRELDSEGKAQDDWNAGKVEILALQYSSGSLGLSLQHGGRNICLLTPTYRADDYAQILERLGPLRQMQSGYQRTVNVFRIMAADTSDSKVFDVAIGKLSAEQAYYDFIQDLQAAR